MCDQMAQERKDQTIAITDSRNMTQDCRKRSIKLAKSLQEDKQSYQEQMGQWNGSTLNLLKWSENFSFKNYMGFNCRVWIFDI